MERIRTDGGGMGAASNRPIGPSTSRSRNIDVALNCGFHRSESSLLNQFEHLIQYQPVGRDRLIGGDCRCAAPIGEGATRFLQNW